MLAFQVKLGTERLTGRERASGVPSPLSTFAIWIEQGLDVPVQSPHDADLREHRWPAEGHDSALRFPTAPVAHSRRPPRGGLFRNRADLLDQAAAIAAAFFRFLRH